MFTIQSDEVSTINQNDVQLWLDNFVKVLGSVGTPIIYYQISSFLKDEEMNSIVNVPEMIFFYIGYDNDIDQLSYNDGCSRCCRCAVYIPLALTLSVLAD